MASNKKIIDLNQTGDRIKEILDANDNVLNTTHAGKVWVTDFEEVEEEGELKSVAKLITKNFSEFEEYKALNSSVQVLYDRIGDPKSTVTITAITPQRHSVQLKNTEDLVIKYKFLSESSGEATNASGSVKWTVTNSKGTSVVEETIYQNIPTGDPEIDKDNYNIFNFSSKASKGVNTIVGEFTDSFKTTKTVSWIITTVDFSLSISNFDRTKINSSSTTINYYVDGLNKNTKATVHFVLDGTEIATVPFYDSDSTKSYTIPLQQHGAHLLKIYATQKMTASAEVSSNVEYFDVMFENNSTDTIIAWPYDEVDLELEQYLRQDFTYSVYTPGNPISNIVLKSKLIYIDANSNQQEILEEERNTMSNWEKEDEKVMTWKYTPVAQMAAETIAQAVLTIECNNQSKTKTFRVKKNAVSINPVTAGLELDFNPQGRTNYDLNYKEFQYVGESGVVTKMTVSDNFDWVNGGWQQDENGNDVFLIKTGSRMFLDYPLFFGHDAAESGRHFKFTYKTANCSNFNAQVMSCIEDQGFSYEIQKTIYVEKDGEVVEDTDNKPQSEFYLNGKDGKGEKIDLLWNGKDLITTSFVKDNRDEHGVGEVINVIVAKSYVGVNFNAQEATLSSSYKNLPLVYCEDELMSVSMDIEPAENRRSLMTAYINMDPSRVVKYPNTSSFTQNTQQSIEFGSNECDVYLYRFKAYNRCFSTEKKAGQRNEIFDDYLADTLDANEILDKYNKNNFLNSDGSINENLLAETCPDLRIILITCPRFTNDKKDKVKGCTVQHILKNGRPEDNWTAYNVHIKGQGTSSNAYGTSARNIDIELNKVLDENERELDYALSYKDANGEEKYATKYAMTDKSIPVNYFNIKVNVASSENANNACLAAWYNEYDAYKRVVRKINGVRDTMEFHPCVIFIREESTSDWEEFAPSYDENENLLYHFYACGDFGNSKKNHEVFGMGEEAAYIVDDLIKNNIIDESERETKIQEYKLKECVVEISNNTHPVTMFKTPDGWDEILPLGFNNATNTLTEYADYWDGDAIEFRYPEDLFAACVNKDNKFSEAEISDARERLNILQPQVQRLWKWVQSTDTTTATDQVLYPSAEYNGVTYNTDSIEYRQAKFLNEYKEYFIKDSLLFQYLFTDRYLMIDNRAKNMFLHTADGLHWDFTMDYDNDTSLGCENSGYLTLDYNLEDIDSINGIPVYNGNDSVLWFNVRTLLKNELEKVYNDDACKEAWSAKNLLEYMSKYQQVKPELLQMMDMQRKYIRPYKTGHGQSSVSEPQYLERLNGRKTYQRKRFETYREIFTGSKYRTASFESSAQVITIRLNNNPGSVEITPYCDMYPYVKWGNERDYPDGDLRVKAGQKVHIDTSRHGLGSAPNQEFHFCGATMLSDLGNLAGLKISEGNFSKGTKIKNLYIGDHTGTISSGVELTNVTLPDSPLLEEFDISNTQFDGSLDFSKQILLKKAYTVGSYTTDITFATNGVLEKAELNSLRELKMEGLTNLKSFSMGYNLLQKLYVKNTPFITDSTKVNPTNPSEKQNIALEFINQLPYNVSGYIENLNLDVYPDSLLNGFAAQTPVRLQLSGEARYDQLLESWESKYKTIWPNLAISYNSLIRQHKITFKDWDDTIVDDTVFITQGGQIDPNLFETIKPKIDREPTPSTIYTFIGWDGDKTNPVYGPREFKAMYAETTREYTVTWKWGDGASDQFSRKYIYGSDATLYENKIPGTEEYYPEVFEPKYQYGVYWLFAGWDNSTSYITEDVIATAIWENGSVSTENTDIDTTTLSAAQIYTISQNSDLKRKFFTYKENDATYFAEKRIKVSLGYTPGNTSIFSNKHISYKITNMQYINGTTDAIYTGKNIFNEDKSWTLFIDMKFSNGALKDYGYEQENKNDDVVFSLSNTMSMRYATGGYVKFNFKETEYINEEKQSGYGIKYTGRGSYILRHKKGENRIDLFLSNISESAPKKYTFNLSNYGVDSNAQLVIGAIKDQFDEYSSGAKFVLHNLTLWEDDNTQLSKGYLGDSDCYNLIRSPQDSFMFDIASFGGYEDGQTSIDFFGAQLVDFTLHTETTDLGENNTKSFFNSKIKEWLNARFYQMLSTQWQSIIKPTMIPSTYVESENSSGKPVLRILKESVYFWVPSMKEMFSNSSLMSQHDAYDEEGSIKDIYGSPSEKIFARAAATKQPSQGTLEEVKANSRQDETDPRSTANILKNEEDIWVAPNAKYYIYKDMEWYPWTIEHQFWLRTISWRGSERFGYKYSNNAVSHQSNGTSKEYCCILPCFSIKRGAQYVE